MEPRSYPKNNWNVICDICGRKIRKKDSILVTDKYSTQYKMVVCKRDFDKTNPQANLKAVPEKNLIDPKYVRPALPDFYAEAVADVLASAPLNLTAQLNSIENVIDLRWETPVITGGRILGYIITRASPQESYQFTIEADTGTEVTFYQDDDSDITEESTYSVAAINALGVGAYSALVYYPAQVTSLTFNYILASHTDFVITTSDDVAILGTPV